MVLLDLGPGPATPSWLPLLMVVLLLGLIGFLYWSMRRNLNRIDFEEREPASPSTPVSPVPPLDQGLIPADPAPGAAGNRG